MRTRRRSTSPSSTCTAIARCIRSCARCCTRASDRLHSTSCRRRVRPHDACHVRPLAFGDFMARRNLERTGFCDGAGCCGVCAMPLTDSLALLFRTCALGGVIAYERAPSAFALALVCVASIALTLTRPAFFLPLGAGAGAYTLLQRSRRPATAAGPLLAAAVATVVYFVFTARAVRPSSASWTLAWRCDRKQRNRFTHFGTQHGPIRSVRRRGRGRCRASSSSPHHNCGETRYGPARGFSDSSAAPAAGRCASR